MDYAALAGMSDEKVKAKTGCTWERWVYALDRHGAEQMSHRDIAALVNEKYKIDGWWSQTVTVGYERIKGLRARGQRRDGTYEATKSRTFNVPVTTLFDAWADASDAPALVEWREREGAHGHGAEIDAARLDRPQHHRGRIRREGQVQELGRCAARETARPRDSGPSQAVLVGSAGRARRSILESRTKRAV